MTLPSPSVALCKRCGAKADLSLSMYGWICWDCYESPEAQDERAKRWKKDDE